MASVGGASGCAAGRSGLRIVVGVAGSGTSVEMEGGKPDRSEVTEGASGVGMSGVEPLEGEDWWPRTSSTSSS